MLGCGISSKILFDPARQQTVKLLQGLSKLATTTRTFMEQVKIIFNQKGFVASGLQAEIRIAMKPVNFAVSM
jgi:hypothetical protein